MTDTQTDSIYRLVADGYDTSLIMVRVPVLIVLIRWVIVR